jgi:LysM repeat protein
MRTWTKSACVVLAAGLIALLAVAGFRANSHPAPATTHTTSSTRTTPVPRPAALTTAVTPAAATAAPAPAAPATWAVRPGDTLTAIASALNVPGGWPALYAANRAVIGPDPGIIQPGTVLVTPRPAAPRQAPAPATSKPAPGNRQPSPPPLTARPRPAPASSTAPAARQPAPGSGTTTAGAMPRWLKDTLLAAALLTLLAFTAELALAASRQRRRRTNRTAPPPRPDGTRHDHHHDPAHQHAAGQRTAEHTARIIKADHERLIVTYSVSDDTVCLLTPPGEDPQAVLRAARLVLPEDTYQELAGHLGVTPGWRE